MRRISISELSSLRWSFHQDVIHYASHGFNSIGIWRSKIDEFEIDETVEFLHEMQMNVSSVHWAGGFTGSDGRSHRESIVDAVEAIELTSHLAGECLIVHPGSRNGHTLAHARRLFVSALQRLLPIAEEWGVTLAIEPMPVDPLPCRSSEAWTFLDDLQSSIDIVNNFSSKNLGLVVDLFHLGLSSCAYEEIDQWADKISLVQFADRGLERDSEEKRLPLGRGHISLEKWLQRLVDVGYLGRFEIELHGAGMDGIAYHEMLCRTAEFFRTETIRCAAAGQFRESSSEVSALQPTMKRSINQ